MIFPENKHFNYTTPDEKIAKGCKLCVQGKKLVLFVTGLCGNGCSYCPVSDEKNLRDVVFANERPVTSVAEVIEEAKLMNAKGAGITGGDPLAVLSRTCEYIIALKKEFGKSFHVHLYTPLLRVTNNSLQQLFDAGLDEIRFHPKVDVCDDWERMLLAKEFDWSMGVEVPLLVGKDEELKKLLQFLADNDIVDFVNLNEFEYADNLVFENAGVHYIPKNDLSYGVKGSVDLGKQLLLFATSLGLSVHVCTAKSKDAVQLAQRMLRRAKNVAKEFDAVDDEGLLTRGAIYVGLSLADSGYQEKLLLLSNEEKQKILFELKKLQQLLLDEWEVPEELLFLDIDRLRLLTTTSVAEAVADELDFTVVLVKEYPTHDCFVVEADVLHK